MVALPSMAAHLNESAIQQHRTIVNLQATDTHTQLSHTAVLPCWEL